MVQTGHLNCTLISLNIYTKMCLVSLVFWIWFIKKNFYYNPYLPLFVCTNQPWNGLNTLSPRNTQGPVPMSCCLSSPRSSTAGCWTWSHSPHLNWRVIPSLPSTLLWRVSCSWIFSFIFANQTVAICGSSPFLRKNDGSGCSEGATEAKCWKKMWTPPVNTKAPGKVERAFLCEQTWCLRYPDESDLLPLSPSPSLA